MTQEEPTGPQRPRDLDPEETADENTDPEYSRTYRVFRWLVDNGVMLLSAAGVLLFVVASFMGVEIPRNLKLIGLSALITAPLVGRPVGKKAKAMMWDPSYIWLIDLDARVMTGGIFRTTSQRFRDNWTVRDGSLDWLTPNLAVGKQVDLEQQEIKGVWRGTFTDRELLATLEAVKECRGQLERDAKIGYKWDMHAFGIIRRATIRAVQQVGRVFERGALPDEGDGLTDEIDAVLADFDLDRKLATVEDDDNPEADVPDLDDLDDLDAPEQEVPADD